MTDLQDFQIITDRAELSGRLLSPDSSFEVREVAAAEVSHLPDAQSARFIEPVSIIAAATAALLAYRLVEHWLSKDEQGVQIDARTQPATVTNIAGIPAGFVVIIAPDGSVTSHASGSLTSSGLASLIGSVVGAKAP
jgi:hypothetical protein